MLNSGAAGQGTTGNECASLKRLEIARSITSQAPTISAVTGSGKSYEGF